MIANGMTLIFVFVRVCVCERIFIIHVLNWLQCVCVCTEMLFLDIAYFQVFFHASHIYVQPVLRTRATVLGVHSILYKEHIHTITSYVARALPVR